MIGDGDKKGWFLVAVVRRWLTGTNVDNGDVVFEWSLLDRLPTKSTLRRKNIHSDNALCVLCEDGEESVDHMFTGCGFSIGVWECILRRRGLPMFFFAFSLKDLMEIHNMYGLSTFQKDIVRGMAIACCWRIWKARSEQNFENKRCKVVEIIADVKALTFLWWPFLSVLKIKWFSLVVLMKFT
ncbi:uncharacterized protein LOC143551729 [Bidens hawaiensis]|uniref:uncharacterized protein LOC143551729 n=1 Tax=Bidens hawaiensis TaxID=980011 RepID=UPI00404A8143